MTLAALHTAETGLRRLLHLIGAIVNPPAEKAPPTPILQGRGGDYYVHALDGGLFEPSVKLSDEVVAEQLAGAIHFPDTSWRHPRSPAPAQLSARKFSAAPSRAIACSISPAV